MIISRFLGILTVALIFMVENCSAMEFSQPVEIGTIRISQRNGAGGFMFENATSNNGDYYTGYDKNNRYSYGKGVVKYGNGVDAIYVHYDAYNKDKPARFGKSEINNTVLVDVFNTWIYKINSNSGIMIYAIGEFYGPDREYTIIGTKKDGTFVKYVDTRNITKQYFGINTEGGGSPIVYNSIKCQGNTIIIPYNDHRKTGGEFRFKWDEKAQWFSVEQVKY